MRYSLFNEGVKLLLDRPLSLVKQNLREHEHVIRAEHSSGGEGCQVSPQEGNVNPLCHRQRREKGGEVWTNARAHIQLLPQQIFSLTGSQISLLVNSRTPTSLPSSALALSLSLSISLHFMCMVRRSPPPRGFAVSDQPQNIINSQWLLVSRPSILNKEIYFLFKHVHAHYRYMHYIVIVS